MKTQFQLEFKDYLDVQQLRMRKSNLASALIIAAAGLYGVVSPSWSIIFGTLFMAGAFLLSRFVILPERIQKNYEQQKEIQAPIEMEITAEALKTSSQYGHAERPWSVFVRWDEDEDVLVIYHSDAMFTILPKRFFSPEQIAMVKAYLQANQVPNQLPLRTRLTNLIFLGVFILIILYLYWNLLQAIWKPL